MGRITEMAREMGRRGAAGRLAKMTPEQRREIARLGAHARWRKASDEAAASKIEAVEPIALPADVPASVEAIEGDSADYIDKTWTPKLVRAWERILDSAMADGDRETAMRIAMAMTAMVPRLTPARMRQLPDGAGALPANIDLSHISTEDLARIAGRRLTPVCES